MDTSRTKRTWLFVFGFVEILCVDSSLLSSLVFTQSEVGLEAVLPCKWDSHTDASSTTPYIQWQTLNGIVFERKGSTRFQAKVVQNRADVPEAVLVRGNCSLHLTDIRFRDAGIYECYLLVGKKGNKRRIFIQSVQLSVHDHKSTQAVELGGDLTLHLYTHQAETVVFQKSDAGEWTEVWQRQGNLSTRVKESDGKLVIRNMRASDEGLYKVIDSEGLALSTVKVTVKEAPSPTVRTMVDKRIALENSVGAISSSPPFSFLLIIFLYLL